MCCTLAQLARKWKIQVFCWYFVFYSFTSFSGFSFHPPATTLSWAHCLRAPPSVPTQNRHRDIDGFSICFRLTWLPSGHPGLFWSWSGTDFCAWKYPSYEKVSEFPEKISFFQKPMWGSKEESDHPSQRWVFKKTGLGFGVLFPEQEGISPACLRLSEVRQVCRLHLNAQWSIHLIKRGLEKGIF